METLNIDFDYMDELAEKASRARARIKMLERTEELLEAKFMKHALLSSDIYWINNRPPTQVVLSKIVAKVGSTDADVQVKEEIAGEIATAYGEWVEATEKLQTCRDRISVYQTESANKRLTKI